MAAIKEMTMKAMIGRSVLVATLALGLSACGSPPADEPAADTAATSEGGERR